MLIVAALLVGCILQSDPPAPAASRQASRPPASVRHSSPEPGARSDDPRDAPIPEFDAPAPARRARSVWEARRVAPDAVRIAAGHYTVRPGDTLGAIAAATGAGIDAIALANGLPPDAPLRPGHRLAIPGGRYHLVRAGQSGIAVARAYGIEWSRIIAANGLTDPYPLRAGQRLLIPDPSGGAATLAERARAFTLDIDDILTGGEPARAGDRGAAGSAIARRPTRSPPAPFRTPGRLRAGFAWPVDGRIVRRFGPGPGGTRNDGIDLAVPLRTAIGAAADGVVAYAGTGIAALGGVVIVRHADGWVSVYGHAARLLVRRGQRVTRGQTIALAGDSGEARRPELHFELRRGRIPVDPLAELPRG